MRVDPRAVGLGAIVAMALAVPVVLVYQMLLNADVIGDESPLAFVFYVMAMAGFATGGFVAGSKRPEAPLSHGALAGLLAFSTVQLIASTVNLIRGDTLNVLQIVFNAMLASGLGLLGGHLSARRTATTPRQ